MLGFKWASITNMGSLAIGAFIIAIVKIMRFLAELYQGENKREGNADAVI